MAARVTGESTRFGERLRHLRLAAGLSQERLAERAGLSARGISDLERGVRRVPYPDTMQLLAGALGVAVTQLTSVSTPPHAAPPAGSDHQPAEPPLQLPIVPSSFIGREDSIAEVTRLLSTTRLLTLVGPGGIGKTRLALEAARSVSDVYQDGALFVELASIGDGALVHEVVARALGVEEHSLSLSERAAALLAARRVLLILDNCEHLVESCAEFVAALLRAGTELRILATSREPLGVAGETSWSVPPLALPDPAQSASADGLLRAEAARLFVERAAAVRSSFLLTDHNAPDIARICIRLDGIPLALELAAARVRALTVEQIAERLAANFRLVAGSGRATVPRHTTLQATIEWSHDLLTADERVLFRRLSVFAGGWSLEAA